MIEERQLTLIMENKPGALVRVVGLFHQRGYNIESLHVEPINNFKPYKFIEDELNTKFSEGEVSRLEIKTTVDDPSNETNFKTNQQTYRCYRSQW
tara:strand:- start:353 stop:637 length:285 start_codon:yes stop_codon:yes gene_type:complete